MAARQRNPRMAIRWDRHRLRNFAPGTGGQIHSGFLGQKMSGSLQYIRGTPWVHAWVAEATPGDGGSPTAWNCSS